MLACVAERDLFTLTHRYQIIFSLRSIRLVPTVPDVFPSVINQVYCSLFMCFTGVYNSLHVEHWCLIADKQDDQVQALYDLDDKAIHVMPFFRYNAAGILLTILVWSQRAVLYNGQLTHWGRVTHICVSKLTINGSDNGLSPGRCQAIIWTI